jgi:hypothetical protein
VNGNESDLKCDCREWIQRQVAFKSTILGSAGYTRVGFLEDKQY